MNVKGNYTITLNFCNMFNNMQLEIKRENLITYAGESFFLNRWRDNKFQPINQIVLGNSEIKPLKNDTKLGNQILSVNPNIRIDLNNMQLILTANIEPSKILGICEIGVMNGDNKLISHDTFTQLTADVLGASSNVQLEYCFNLESGHTVLEWTPSRHNIYYTQVSSEVKGVYDDKGNGYRKKEDLDSLDEYCYYYSTTTQRVYVYRGAEQLNDRITIKG